MCEGRARGQSLVSGRSSGWTPLSSIHEMKNQEEGDGMEEGGWGRRTCTSITPTTKGSKQEEQSGLGEVVGARQRLHFSLYQTFAVWTLQTTRLRLSRDAAASGRQWKAGQQVLETAKNIDKLRHLRRAEESLIRQERLALKNYYSKTRNFLFFSKFRRYQYKILYH